MALTWDVIEGIFRQCVGCGERDYPDESRQTGDPL